MRHKRTLRIALIASSRYPIVQPFAGGLEAHIWALVRALSQRGHAVTLFAARGSDPAIARRLVTFAPIADADGRRDLSADDNLVASENDAYRSIVNRLADVGAAEFDLVHNHSLHPAPLAALSRLGLPMISTFHTPPLPRLVRVLAGVSPGLCLVAVSRHAARSWSTVTSGIHVVHNGADIDAWPKGAGGGPLIWFGRLVPEKGAELAIDAARITGRPLDLAGPIIDAEYFRREIEPRLGGDVRYLGHLTQPELAAAVGRATVALVTPRWDEPYGLVVAEALSCGTPVAAFARGGIPEIVDARSACLAPSDDVCALAGAVDAAAMLSRSEVRRHAERHCSMAGTVDAYEELYRSHVPERSTPHAHASVTRRVHPHPMPHLHAHALPHGIGAPAPSP